MQEDESQYPQSSLTRNLHKSVEQIRRTIDNNSRSEVKKRPDIPLLDFSNLPRSSDSDREIHVAAPLANQQEQEQEVHTPDKNISLSVSIKATKNKTNAKVNGPSGKKKSDFLASSVKLQKNKSEK